MATNNKPANTLRCGNIKATIWENTSEKGPFFTATFYRPFKDQSVAWHNGTSFGLNALKLLSLSRVMPRNGLPLTCSNVEHMNGKPPVLRGLLFQGTGGGIPGCQKRNRRDNLKLTHSFNYYPP
jgi:hypothetical protein